jgi:4-aminobutyrate aminotransferase-like enzyme
MAVLDVIENEELQENALQVGKKMLNGFAEIKKDHSIIGDVRGAGLFIGVELVSDQETLEPATEDASTIIEKMKDRDILLSTDGPFDNVIKIKPPIVFSEDNAERVVETLDEVLTEMNL